MVATNESELTELFEPAIAGITPRLQYKGAMGWKPYSQAKSGPAGGTRWFRLLWSAGNVQPGGAVAGDLIEHFAELRVRTDYGGEHAKNETLMIDDFHQVADTLTSLKAGNNGVMLVTRQRVEYVAGDENEDVVQVDHVMTVRYMRRIQL